ncbi:hypothetical protein V3C99_008041 [Haemonchus contortus]|uniref:ShKT domain-containing protein n=1 Tax=Haemonchus contortus TaxID=6289 RepID=A0A7I4Z6B6_HAECO
MLFTIVCALFLLSAFSAESSATVPCMDLGDEAFCVGRYREGLCKEKDFQAIAKTYCAKTCGICH